MAQLYAHNRQNGYPDDIWDLVKRDGEEDRSLYRLLAPFGHLFDGIYRSVGKPARSVIIFEAFLKEKNRKIYDNSLRDWISFSPDFFESLPMTYTFAQRPINTDMEVDYFCRSFGLPKHRFIWSDDHKDGLNGVTLDLFASLKSTKNTTYRGRYTFTPWMPKIENLGTLLNGFYLPLDDFQ